MNNSSPAELVAGLLCLVPICLGGLGLAAGGGLLLWLSKRQRQAPSPPDPAGEKEALQSEVASQMHRLQPWRQEALADLRTFRNIRWRSFGRTFRMRGLIAAARSARERTWAAFALHGRRVYRGPTPFHGEALVRTTAQAFDFHVQASGEVVIQVEGRPLGTLQPDGTLLDAQGMPVGRLSSRAEKDRSTYPLTLHGRVIARLGNPFYGGHFRFLRKVALPPAVEITAPDITPDEHDWLLALALWNVLLLAAIQVDSSGVV